MTRASWYGPFVWIELVESDGKFNWNKQKKKKNEGRARNDGGDWMAFMWSTVHPFIRGGSTHKSVKTWTLLLSQLGNKQSNNKTHKKNEKKKKKRNSPHFWSLRDDRVNYRPRGVDDRFKWCPFASVGPAREREWGQRRVKVKSVLSKQSECEAFKLKWNLVPSAEWCIAVTRVTLLIRPLGLFKTWRDCHPKPKHTTQQQQFEKERKK